MRRAVRAILRLIAAGLILFGGLEIGLEWMRRQVDKTGIRTGRCLVGAALIALGVLGGAWLISSSTQMCTPCSPT